MLNEPIYDGEKIAIVNLTRGETADICAEPVKENALMLKEGEDGCSIEVFCENELFTKYVYDSKFAKPYLGPILLSNGSSVTRLDFETTEHPHQRSIIIAVGDVNGIDFWNEPVGHGNECHAAIEDMFCDGNSASFKAKNVWKDADGTLVCDEARRFTFYAQPHECRYIDIEVTFTASYGKVEFGNTKEAGPLGIRVNESMRADKTGSFSNSYGAVDEDECWGRSASWCEYHGNVDGLDAGIAVFDNEDNERYPTAWHIRNYGLFAANNLFFKGGLTINEGESLTYKYRVVVYEGRCNIADRFINYAK